MIDIRFITIKDNIYLRKEDVINFIREIAATEERDTRIRLEEASNNLVKIKNKEE